MLVALPVRASLPEPAADSLRRLIVERMEGLHLPGLSVAVAVDSQIVFSSGFGLADIARERPVDRSSIFRIASVSKPITATAVMQLVEQGKIDLDAPVQRYCPWFPLKPWPVTVRRLLSHTSGIRHYRTAEESDNTHHYGSLRESLEIFDGDSLLFEPGTRFNYTSYGYSLLGCVIEGASGMSYEEYLQRYILRPTGMSTTYVYGESFDTLACVRGYGRLPNGRLRYAQWFDLSDRIPGGGILSTAEDLVRFAVALESGRLLGEASLRAMWTPQKTIGGQILHYGFGWVVLGRDEDRQVLHDGSQYGTRSLLMLLPERKIAVALLANMEGDDVGTMLTDVAVRILDVVAGS